MTSDKRTFTVNPNLETDEEEEETPVSPFEPMPTINPVAPQFEPPPPPVYVNTRPDMDLSPPWETTDPAAPSLEDLKPYAVNPGPIGPKPVSDEEE